MESEYESSPYGIIVFDAGLNITACNKSMQKILGAVGDYVANSKNLLELLPLLNRQVLEANRPVKVVIVAASAHAGVFRNGYASSSHFTTIIDDSGTVEGGTIVIRERTDA